MPKVNLTTFIAAPVERVFDLARHMGLLKQTMAFYKQEILTGSSYGLIGADETITWKGKHLFKQRILKLRYSGIKKYESFIEEQVVGDLKSFRHEHHFKPCENGTIMIDVVEFTSPYGFAGHILNQFYLTQYIHDIIQKRITAVKSAAETDSWKVLLNT